MDYITNERYTENVVARCSNEYHDIIPAIVTAANLASFAKEARILDVIKKALFYGKLDEDYQAEIDMVNVVRPRPANAEDLPNFFGLYQDSDEPIVLNEMQIQLFHAILGIATEAGELVEAFIEGLSEVQTGNKSVEQAFDNINMREELGDVQWYVALGLNAINSGLSECMTINDNKLEKRYGPAFSSDRANERDLSAERQELEG